MPFVVVGGRRTHVQRLGSWAAAADARVPAVMVHGLFTGTLASWFFTCAPAVAKQRPVLLYDLRGHGRTDEPADGDHTSIAQARDLLELTGDLPRLHLVGHSFGALIAIRFAVAHPERVASLALVEPPVRADGEDAWWWGTADEESSGPASGRNGPDRAAVMPSLRAEVEVSDDHLVALPAALAVVVGDRGPARAVTARIERVRPDASIAVLPAGHSVQVDARDELSSFLVSFLAVADRARPVPVLVDDGVEEDVAYG